MLKYELQRCFCMINLRRFKSLNFSYFFVIALWKLFQTKLTHKVEKNWSFKWKTFVLAWKSKTRVTSCKLRVQIYMGYEFKCRSYEFQSTSYEFRYISYESKLRVASSNPRFTSSDPRVRRLKSRVARLKVKRLKAQAEVM